MDNQGVAFPWKRGLLPTLGVMAAVFVLFVAGSVVTEIAFVLVSGLLGDALRGLSKPTSMFIISVIGIVGYIVGSVMAIAFLKRCCGTNSALTLVKGRVSDVRSIGNVVLWAFIGFIAVHALDALYMLLPVPMPKVPSSEAAATMSGAALVVFALGASFLGPIYEEIICRGFIFNMLRSSFAERYAGSVATILAMVISAAFFSAFHMTLSAFVPLFIFGLVAAEIYRRTGSIYTPMLMHFFNNALVSVVFLLS